MYKTYRHRVRRSAGLWPVVPVRCKKQACCKGFCSRPVCCSSPQSTPRHQPHAENVSGLLCLVVAHFSPSAWPLPHNHTGLAHEEDVIAPFCGYGCSIGDGRSWSRHCLAPVPPASERHHHPSPAHRNYVRRVGPRWRRSPSASVCWC